MRKRKKLWTFLRSNQLSFGHSFFFFFLQYDEWCSFLIYFPSSSPYSYFCNYYYYYYYYYCYCYQCYQYYCSNFHFLRCEQKFAKLFLTFFEKLKLTPNSHRRYYFLTEHFELVNSQQVFLFFSLSALYFKALGPLFLNK